jgi:hypothetical protein
MSTTLKQFVLKNIKNNPKRGLTVSELNARANTRFVSTKGKYAGQYPESSSVRARTYELVKEGDDCRGRRAQQRNRLRAGEQHQQQHVLSPPDRSAR